MSDTQLRPPSSNTRALVRILLDNFIPARLRFDIVGHEVQSAVFADLAHLDDGDLLDAIEGRFDVLVTIDRNMRLQPRIAGRPFSVAILRAPSNRPEDLRQCLPIRLTTLAVFKPSEVREIP